MTLKLRPYKPCDADAIIRWIRDEETLRMWSADRFDAYPITADDINHKYCDLNGDCAEPDNFYPFTAMDESGRAAGHLILRYTDPGRTTVRFGFVIVDDEMRGRGLGKQLLELAAQYAFGIFGARRITLGVFEHNVPAYRCYRAAGFRETGETRTCRISGQERRIIEMAREQ